MSNSNTYLLKICFREVWIAWTLKGACFGGARKCFKVGVQNYYSKMRVYCCLCDTSLWCFTLLHISPCKYWMDKCALVWIYIYTHLKLAKHIMIWNTHLKTHTILSAPRALPVFPHQMLLLMVVMVFHECKTMFETRDADFYSTRDNNQGAGFNDAPTDPKP